jgi:hypothetical protein
VNSISQLDIRGERLYIVRDLCPEHPLDTTDAPWCIDTYSSRAVYWHHGEHRAERPIAATFSRDTGLAGIYFNGDGNECEYFDASGALYVDREDWQAYAGAPITLAKLRAQLAELRAYWHGDVYGYSIIKTFRRAGEIYITDKILDDCYGFYGADGIASMANYLRPCFRTFVRRLAKALKW